MARLLLAFLAGSVLAAARQDYPDPQEIFGDMRAHDPTMVKTFNGTYIVPWTGPNLNIKTSEDRKKWTDVGVAFPDGAEWALEYTDGSPDLWAPDISFRNGQFYMYYAASQSGLKKAAIFLATSPDGMPGTWKHEGLIVNTSDSVDYNAIDPNLHVDNSGNWYLAFGSFESGLKLLELDPATGLPLSDDLVSIARRPPPDDSIEAAFITHRGDFFYLWVAFDHCCVGAASTYRVMVGRSRLITGPYVDKEGTDMLDGGATEELAGHGSIHGPGHPAVLLDDEGEILVYHYYADDDTALLGINEIKYDDDAWPFIV